MKDQDIEKVLKAAGAREKPPPEVERAVREGLRAEWRVMVGAPPGMRRRRIGLALAAGVAAAAIGAWLAWPRPDGSGDGIGRVAVASEGLRVKSGFLGGWDSAESGQSLAAGDRVETDSAGRGALALAGGVFARLDGDTRMTLVSATELSLERGALYVDAGLLPAAAARLDVSTPSGTVRHLGTQYEVRLIGSGVRLRVREGRVEWTSTAGAVAKGRGGEQLTIAGDGTVARLAAPIYGETWDWIASATPDIAIEGLPLSKFLSWAARELGHELRFQGESTAREAETTILHGSISGLGPREALAAVMETTRLRASVAAGRVTISSREDPEPLGD